MRTIVDLKDDQLDNLARICSREKISRAEAVRQAVALFIATKGSLDAKAAFGIWKNRKVDGLEYQQQIRNEW